MTTNTFPLRSVPQSWGAWDTMVQSARRQHEDNQAHEAAIAQEERRLADAMEEALSEGDVRAPAFFAVSRNNPNKALPLFEEVYGAADTAGLRADWCQLMVDAALGMDIKDRANAWIKALSERFGHNEAGLVEPMDPVTAAGFGGGL